MERQCEGICQSSNDIETRETDGSLFGLKGILVWKRVVVFGAVAWELDTDLTAKRNGCSFQERASHAWKDMKFA